MAFRILSRLPPLTSFANKTLSRQASQFTSSSSNKHQWLKKVGTGVAVLCAGGVSVYKAKDDVPLLRSCAAVSQTKGKSEPVATPTVLKPQKNGLMTAKTPVNTSGCRRGGNGKKPQPNVCTPLKSHTLFLWITLKPNANPCSTIKAAVGLQCMVDEMNDPCNPQDDIVAGVGFGPNFYSQVMGKTMKNYYYTHRKGKHGDMPSSCGDILVHAKCENRGKLFDLCQNYLRSLPADSIEEFDDVYSFNYRDGRDLSGFLVNQVNRFDAAREIAIEEETGGSYALAQKWVHDLCAIDDAGQKTLECYIGRDMECGRDMPRKTNTAHVSRMNGGTDYQDPPPYECIRQAQPYGHLSGDAGLFYICFSNDPCSFEFMLDRMIGASCDGGHDDVMKMSCNVKGTYWYFPGLEELQQLQD